MVDTTGQYRPGGEIERKIAAENPRMRSECTSEIGDRILTKRVTSCPSVEEMRSGITEKSSQVGSRKPTSSQRFKITEDTICKSNCSAASYTARGQVWEHS